MAQVTGIIPVRNRGSEGESPARKRSRVACRGCNHRKVRCDVTRTGIPCSNCFHEAAPCEVVPRKKHRPRRPRNAVQSTSPTIQDDQGNHEGPITFISNTQQTVSEHRNGNNHVFESVTQVRREERDAASQLVGFSRRQEPSLSQNSPAEGTSKDPPSTVDRDEVLPDDSSLTYIGDTRGPRFFVYDLCHPEAPQDAMPQLLPRQSDISWKPHEVEYLRHQGAFITPPDDICDDLIRCYFHHVHFFLPVVDAASFLAEYDNNGRQNISLLLFWSMLLAAANFVEADVLQRSGFASRKAMKVAFYERAKALYDLDHGTDKLVLIQSVILMAFWYTDPQDHTGAWYWIGIAISLSQTLGLHRCPQPKHRSQGLPAAQQPAIRRIWWSCVVRDRWLSLAKGRPLRIHHEDCDISVPEAGDIMNNLAGISAATREKFIPPDSEMLAKMWVSLVKISDSLGKILRIHYRASGLKPIFEDVDCSMMELQRCQPNYSLTDDASDLLQLHAYHVELFYEATVAVLYRPYVLSETPALRLETPTSWKKGALEQARTAAANTNSVLERIIELNTVHLLKPMIITTIIPAMQIHLFECKSSVPLRRGLGKNKLSLCMLVLSQLRDTYWSAGVIFRLFERAQTMLDKSKSHSKVTTPTEKPTRSHRRSDSHSTTNADPQYQPQHPPQQHQDNNLNSTMNQIPDPNLLMPEQGMPNTYWFNDSGSPCFSNVDQLLSPGFTVPENMYQPLFTGYDNGIGGEAYDQLLAQNNGSVGMLYNA